MHNNKNGLRASVVRALSYGCAPCAWVILVICFYIKSFSAPAHETNTNKQTNHNALGLQITVIIIMGIHL